MPPANDNWSAAQAISGSTGNLASVGTCIGATTEVGEPGYNGNPPQNTVWYVWTPPTAGQYYFATLFEFRGQAPGIGPTNCRTILQIFSGGAVSTLTEIPYIQFGGNWNVAYSDWDFGSIVAIQAFTSSVYYIRVDTIGTPGTFPLMWATWFTTFNGPCQPCPPLEQFGATCLGSITMPTTVAGGTITSFGTFAAGRYVIRYCYGAWQFNNGVGRPPWTVMSWIDKIGPLLSGSLSGHDSLAVVGTPQSTVSRAITPTTFIGTPCGLVTLEVTAHGLATGDEIVVKGVGGAFAAAYNTCVASDLWRTIITFVDSDHFTYLSTNSTATETTTADTGGIVSKTNDWIDLPNQTSAGETGFPTQLATTDAFSCTYMVLQHNGGDISLLFRDDPYNDNSDGSPNPIFGIYTQGAPQFEFNQAHASWVSQGISATVTFTIINSGPFGWSGITASLDSSGGISGSSTVTGISIGTSTTITLTFNCATPNVTATLRLQSVNFPADVLFVVFLGPIITFTGYTSVVDAGFCGVNKLLFFCDFLNSGCWDEPAAPAPNWQISQSTSFIFVTFGFSGCNGSSTGPINQSTLDTPGVTRLTQVSSGALNANGGTVTIGWSFKSQGVVTPSNITFAFTDSGANIGTITFPITVPI